jgi:hypothetical protein
MLTSSISSLLALAGQAALRIGAANRGRGFSPSGVRAMVGERMNQRRLMARYPPNG